LHYVVLQYIVTALTHTHTHTHTQSLTIYMPIA